MFSKQRKRAILYQLNALKAHADERIDWRKTYVQGPKVSSSYAMEIWKVFQFYAMR